MTFPRDHGNVLSRILTIGLTRRSTASQWALLPGGSEWELQCFPMFRRLSDALRLSCQSCGRSEFAISIQAPSIQANPWVCGGAADQMNSDTKCIARLAAPPSKACPLLFSRCKAFPPPGPGRRRLCLCFGSWPSFALPADNAKLARDSTFLPSPQVQA